MESQEFICECGKYKGWITDSKLTVACPNCANVYRGKYNPKTLRIEAVYVGPDDKHITRRCSGHKKPCC